ncbi:MAG: hypothetical protein JSU96_01940 [Acidobacteriota bacterium]|nr:MAG: hypothetical protein JSU96_01940 [Acidobacteriota bacterium]
MPKRIYVGLSKFSGSELETLSKRTGISASKLRLAAAGKLILDADEEKRLERALAPGR